MAQLRAQPKEWVWKGIGSPLVYYTHCGCKYVTPRELLEFKCKIMHFEYT